MEPRSRIRGKAILGLELPVCIVESQWSPETGFGERIDQSYRLLAELGGSQWSPEIGFGESYG